VVIVVGIGADGWEGLSPSARAWLESAPVVVGGRRHLELLPDVPGQHRAPWPSPLRERLPDLLDQLGRESHVVAIASGDPLVSGVATTLIDLLGRDQVLVVPAVSSVSLARAAMRWPAESCSVVSLVGRDVSLLRRELAPGRRVLVLSADERTPALVARLLLDSGYGDSGLTVLGDLGGPTESSAAFDNASVLTAEEPSFPRLNVVAVECAGPHVGGWVPGLPDDAFEHDGQLTRRDLRASALARLAPVPGEHLWDVGAGAGSVGIEWMRAHPSCTATAVEADPGRAERIGRNAAGLGVPGLQVVQGRAPEALAALPAPGAIFVGGGATRAGVVETCLAALRGGGRLVVHGVTLETEQLLASLYRQYGGELARIATETAAPIGSFTGWTPARAVTQWAFAV
jgi:precorrin-6Y C5,15-methyltransferase (decarboxylating)